MEVLLFFPFILQMILIGLDEILFHLKRGLPRWERIGHPIDTLSVVFCFLIALKAPFNSFWLKTYVIMGLISCLLITKDEFIHKEKCEASEQWLHACLFINHSLLLTAMGVIWAGINGIPLPLGLVINVGKAELVLGVTALMTLCFMGYQAIYWNFIWKEKSRSE